MRSSTDSVKASEARVKGLALQIATQLPTDPAEARSVMRHVEWLLENFFEDGQDRAVKRPTPKLMRV